eukprot:CAMPEP_0197643230 /NCGR_PEP_ID=MMETSP1338-20131121/16627_1 /TAXON_ID=43686 ORGANISM="Pelagodinium beii, Strain RCC1491" /NCGR_SAMPLE_ID=MMETSP1338 /ASSEMBLY_ACC=CAM_ASM_000754 /LENGTH=153 /DNA_ID=CAMNT_0043216461 /DNA_START=86 /DNA_END=547 /DNA_ORIENTATION=-
MSLPVSFDFEKSPRITAQSRVSTGIETIVQSVATSSSEDDAHQDSPKQCGPAGNHADGTCTPCKFFRSTTGCQKGSECNFCHFRHERKPRSRPGKSDRVKYKRLQSMLANDAFEDERHRLAAEAIASRNPYMRKLMQYHQASQPVMAEDPRQP